MSQLSPSVHLIITLPLSDYTPYLEAVRLLNRTMGKKAPDPISLIVHTLRCRDVRGLADDYLESVGWPLKPLKATGSDLRNARHSRGTGRKIALPRSAAGDPARN